MKRMLRSLLLMAAVLTVACLSPCGSWAAESPAAPAPAKKDVFAKGLAAKALKITAGMTPEAAKCVECHAKKTPGIVASWKESQMSHAGVSCYDCHAVEKSSPMASQCSGIKGTNVFISPMVSSKTCAKCHPTEVKQFLESGHARLAGAPIIEKAKFQKLMYDIEGGGFMGVQKGTTENAVTRITGCQKCHGTQAEVGPDHLPIKGTWPGGVGERYPDGSIGNCTVCHTRHKFSIAEARKPEACASCHLGPDHPDAEIYASSKHGQIYAAQGHSWKWDSAPGTWQPGDYTAPTCATCHMSGIGNLTPTHNVDARLKWDLMHPKSVIRSGARGDGEQGEKQMRKVCLNCHGPTEVDSQFKALDDTVALYNTYYEKAEKMRTELQAKGLLKKDPWKDGFQELYFYLWHHAGRRFRQGAAMDGPDYAHWHGSFQVVQLFKNMQQIYDYRIKHNKIEDMTTVMTVGSL